jgi:hypothetical protein
VTGNVNPSYPLYVLSKGRADTAPTPRVLDRMQVPYRLVIEQQEHDDYVRWFPEDRLLHLDPAYVAAYDPCTDLTADDPRGSGPARNFAWEHSIAEGHAWHWVIDDNITGWFRFHQNQKVPCGNGTPFAAMERFATRYSNVAIAGPHYQSFSPARSKAEPFQTGSRVFSCLLIRNAIPFRWECRYNEDVDLCLRVLKAGWATILFQAFLSGKVTTLRMGGGNTDTVYTGGTLAKSRMLVARHPDVATLARRWNRWHHYVDYSQWRGQPLILDPDWTPPEVPLPDLTRVPAEPSYWLPGSFFNPDAVRRWEAEGRPGT